MNLAGPPPRSPPDGVRRLQAASARLCAPGPSVVHSVDLDPALYKAAPVPPLLQSKPLAFFLNPPLSLSHTPLHLSSCLRQPFPLPIVEGGLEWKEEKEAAAGFRCGGDV